MKTAFITGIQGQTGSYLADLLLKKGYAVHGLVRRASTINTERIAHALDRIKLYYGDLTDGTGLVRILSTVQPDEVYHLGAQSHVRISFECPEYTTDVVAGGSMRMLEAVRQVNPKIRYYNAASSEMFGLVQETPQRETTQFYPRSPYGAAKVCAYWMTVNYREAYGIHANNGVLFNHESPRRAENFVTRKITKAIARIKRGLQDKVFLGNLDAKRDWGFAGDYVVAQWMMLQHSVPGDYVVATGETHSVREFVETAFSYADLDWKKYVEIDECLFRPAEVDLLLGDPSKIKRVLGWEPKVKFNDLVKMMVEADYENLSKV